MKRLVSVILAVMLIATASGAFAGNAGTQSDPLVSLSYINDTYIPETVATGAKKIDSAFRDTYNTAKTNLDEVYDSFIMRTGGPSGYTLTDGFESLQVSTGKGVYVATGGSFILTSGKAVLTIEKGTVIDITTGKEVPSGTKLTANTRYFCAENTAAIYTATSSSTGTVDGYYKLTNGAETAMGYSDVKLSSWYFSAVYFVNYNKLMDGATGTTFAPNQHVTRAVFVEALYRLAGSPAVTTAASFPDVPSSSKNYNAIMWANENDIVYGFTDGSFGPEKNVTREQMAAIMQRYVAYAGKSTSYSSDAKYNAFPDKSSVSSYAVDCLKWAVDKGIINGSAKGNTTVIDPKGTASRAHVAQILLNFYNNLQS